MKKFGLMLFGAALLAGTALVPRQSNAAVIRPVPDLKVLTADADVLVPGVGSIDLDVPATLEGTAVSFGDMSTTYNVDGPNGAQVTISGTGDIDPFLNFAIAVTDLGAPSAFTFVFSIPLSPALVGLQTVTSTLGITVTSVSGTTATLTPTFGNVMLVNVGACAAGVDIGSGVSVASPGSNTIFFNDTGTFSPTAGCDSNLTAFIAFSGSGGNTNYGLTGGVIINAVPEPASVGILGMAVLGMLGIRRRSNATS